MGSIKWSPVEERRLISEMKKGMSLEDVMEAHGRTKSAIINRLYRLGKAGRIKWSIRDTDTSGDTVKEQQLPKTDEKTEMKLSTQVTQLERAYVNLTKTVHLFLDGKATLERLRKEVNE